MDIVHLNPGGNRRKPEAKTVIRGREERYLLFGQFTPQAPDQPQGPIQAKSVDDLLGILNVTLPMELEDDQGEGQFEEIPFRQFSDLNPRGWNQNCRLLQHQQWRWEAIDNLKRALHKSPQLRRALAQWLADPGLREKKVEELRVLLAGFRQARKSNLQIK